MRRACSRCGMRGAVVFLALLLCGGFPRAALAQQNIDTDSILSACDAADSTAAWARTARQYTSNSVAPANAELRAQLLRLDSIDQSLRIVPNLMDSIRSPDFQRRMMQLDSTDAKALMTIVARWGWPGRTLVGPDGAKAAFLIAQHNDAIREQALALMLAMPKGEVNLGDLATLQDRVLVKQGKPQKYATQLEQKADAAVMTFDPIEDLPNIDRTRAEVGLMPLSAYICVIRGFYGRDVVDPRKR